MSEELPYMMSAYFFKHVDLCEAVYMPFYWKCHGF
jgi:hypothetical protein